MARTSRHLEGPLGWSRPTSCLILGPPGQTPFQAVDSLNPSPPTSSMEGICYEIIVGFEVDRLEFNS